MKIYRPPPSSSPPLPAAPFSPAISSYLVATLFDEYENDTGRVPSPLARSSSYAPINFRNAPFRRERHFGAHFALLNEAIQVAQIFHSSASSSSTFLSFSLVFFEFSKIRAGINFLFFLLATREDEKFSSKSSERWLFIELNFLKFLSAM